jgi:hypothetical protein
MEASVIYDCFMLAGELDILECRLATMAPYEVHHIIIEGCEDNRGNLKPYSFQENEERFSRHRDRITFVPALRMPGPEPWDREHQLRDMAGIGLHGRAQPGDWVLIADVDEIPTLQLLESPRAGMLMMRNMMLTVDQALPDLQPTSVMVKWPLHHSLSAIRDARYGLERLEPGGWHLSWLGGEEAVQRKLAMHCHTWAETEAQLRQLVPNDDMPPWCRKNAPSSWWSTPSEPPR